MTNAPNTMCVDFAASSHSVIYSQRHKRWCLMACLVDTSGKEGFMPIGFFPSKKHADEFQELSRRLLADDRIWFSEGEA